MNQDNNGSTAAAVRLLPVVFFVISFGIFAYHTVPLLSFPYELRYGEGIVLDQARRVHEEPGLYPPFDQPPYLIGNYPPVYPVVASLIPSPASSPFFGGRLLSTVSVLLSAVLLFLIVRRESNEAAGWIAGGLFLFFPELTDFGALMRIDALALTLGLVGFFCTTQRETIGAAEDEKLRSVTGWRLVGAVAFFFSVYTRHSMIGLPIAGYAIVGARAWRSEGGRAAALASLVWPLGLTIVGAAAFLVANIAYDGEPFNHLIFMNRLPYQWSRVEINWFLSMCPWRYPLVLAALLALWPAHVAARERSVAARWAFLFGFAIAALATVVVTAMTAAPSLASETTRDTVTAWLRAFHITSLLLALGAVVGWTGIPERDAPTRLAGWLLLIGMGSATLIGRVGSDVNYLFEYFAVNSICVGLACVRLSGKARWVAVGLAVTFVVANFVTLSTSRETRPWRRDQIATRERTLRRILEVEDPVLSQDPGLLAMLGRPLHYQPFMYRQLADANVWDPAPLAQAVRDRKFGAIIIVKAQPGLRSTVDGRTVVEFGPVTEYSTDGFPREVIEAYSESYVPVQEATTIESRNDTWREVRILLVPRDN